MSDRETKVASFRWEAMSPNGSGAVPAGKDLRALRTTDSAVLTGGGVGEGVPRGLFL